MKIEQNVGRASISRDEIATIRQKAIAAQEDPALAVEKYLERINKENSRLQDSAEDAMRTQTEGGINNEFSSRHKRG